MQNKCIGSMSVEELMLQEQKRRRELAAGHRYSVIAKSGDKLKRFREYVLKVDNAKKKSEKTDEEEKLVSEYAVYLENTRKYYLANGMKSLSEDQEEDCRNLFLAACDKVCALQ